MRRFLFAALPAVLFLSSSARAQIATACGPADVKFDVKTTRGPQTAPVARPGKALIYFLQDDLRWEALHWDSIPRPTTRFAIDGAWVGAAHANSYFFVYVDPGKHHLCASWQSALGKYYAGTARTIAALHFTAQAGETYYFRAQDIALNHQSGGTYLAEIRLRRVESDEARVIISTFSFSSSHKEVSP